MGRNPGIYNTWYVLILIRRHQNTDYGSRPAAQAQVDGISFASHQAFGNPHVAWEAYEERRLQNRVHRLPFVPTPITPLPRVRSSRCPMSAPASRHPPPGNPESTDISYTTGPGIQSNIDYPSASKVPAALPGTCFQPASPSPRPHFTCGAPQVVEFSGSQQEPCPTASSVSFTSALAHDQHTLLVGPSVTRTVTPVHDSIVVTTSLSPSHSISTARPAFRASPASPAISVIHAWVTAHGHDSTLLMRRITSEDDPRKGKAAGYVVFKGLAPGIYMTW